MATKVKVNHNTTSIKRALFKLSQLREKYAIAAERKQAEVEEAMTATVRSRLSAIDRRYDGKLETARAKMEALELAIKEATVAHGESVKGEAVAAIFNKGRITWDTSKLMGYAEAHPAVKKFMSIGAPFAAIRACKKNSEGD